MRSDPRNFPSGRTTIRIQLKKITVRQLVEGYVDDGQGGVRGYGGRLDIRPPYQREFIYGGDQREAVIRTAAKGFPLNVMYWHDRGDGNFEVIDGQQRTISLAQFVAGEFRVDLGADGTPMFADNEHFPLEDLLDYELDVYLCKGTPKERLDWFETINIAGEKLEKQELRNAVYHGPWTAAAKKWFNDAGQRVAGDYMPGAKKVKRQHYFETAIKWIKDKSQTIEEYMADHKNDANASELTGHFRAVIDRVKAVFPNYRQQMKSVDWGAYYEELTNPALDPGEMEREVARLMEDDDVKVGPGIYVYLLTGEERHLHLRSFDKATKQVLFERMGGICAGIPGVCEGGKKVEIGDLEADHIKPWSKGGKTKIDNCQLVCRDCNRRKGAK